MPGATGCMDRMINKSHHCYQALDCRRSASGEIDHQTAVANPGGLTRQGRPGIV